MLNLCVFIFSVWFLARLGRVRAESRRRSAGVAGHRAVRDGAADGRVPGRRVSPPPQQQRWRTQRPLVFGRPAALVAPPPLAGRGPRRRHPAAAALAAAARPRPRGAHRVRRRRPGWTGQFSQCDCPGMLYSEKVSKLERCFVLDIAVHFFL
jgi:hypothetical protein